MEIKPPCKGIQKLCAALGKDYSVRLFDLEQVIYRDFGNGFDVEISGVNTNSSTKKATIYLWDNRNGNIITKQINNVEQADIGDKVEQLFREVGSH